MKEIRCNKCLRYKKPELIARYVKSPQGKGAVCSYCDERIKEAAKRSAF